MRGGIKMGMEELEKVIRGRRSVRAWEDRPVEEEKLLRAVELATWAPNGGNQQNWYFYIILNRDVIRSIAEATQAGMSYMMSWPEMNETGGFQPLRRGADKNAPPPPRRSPMSEAPAIIAVGTKKNENPMQKVMRARAKTDERAAMMNRWNETVDSRIQSVSAAITTLLLVLHRMELGAVWMTGPLPSSKGDIEKLLKVPEEMDIVALIPVGYPAVTPSGTRKPVGEVSEVIR
jgi:nitroreductase